MVGDVRLGGRRDGWGFGERLQAGVGPHQVSAVKRQNPRVATSGWEAQGKSLLLHPEMGHKSPGLTGSLRRVRDMRPTTLLALGAWPTIGAAPRSFPPRQTSWAPSPGRLLLVLSESLAPSGRHSLPLPDLWSLLGRRWIERLICTI